MVHFSVFRSFVLIAIISLTIGIASASHAGGLFADIIRPLAPDVADTLDDAHRQIKDAIPPYKMVEEGLTKTVNEAFVQAGAPILQELIAQSRNDALSNGVYPIPQQVRTRLEGFVSKEILDIARYRVRGGGDLTLQANAIRYGEASAITLDYVIVFKEEADALNNPQLWVHELTHVDQYQRWGIKNFSIRYLRSYASVEQEAYDAETRYLAWTGVNRSQALRAGGYSPNTETLNYQASVQVIANVCATRFGVFPMAPGVLIPVGVPCHVMVPQGMLPGIANKLPLH